jgi:hypothetical protein
MVSRDLSGIEDSVFCRVSVIWWRDGLTESFWHTRAEESVGNDESASVCTTRPEVVRM